MFSFQMPLTRSGPFSRRDRESFPSPAGGIALKLSKFGIRCGAVPYGHILMRKMKSVAALAVMVFEHKNKALRAFMIRKALYLRSFFSNCQFE